MYELVIICPNEHDFIIECNKYARFKQESGVTCLVHPFDQKIMEQKLKDLPFLQKEGIDPNLLTDAAACLKVDLIRYYRGTGTRYVLLAGDVDKIPVPWFEFIQSGKRYFYPTDLYYADLFKVAPNHRSLFQTWDPDRDAVKGEFQANQISVIDFKPDLAVGRIPASNANELGNTFKRLMSRQPRKPRCLLLRGNDDGWTQWFEDIKNEAANLLTARGYFVTSMAIDQNANASLENSILNKLNTYLSNGCEYIFWFGHGGTGSWGRFGNNPIIFSNIMATLNGAPIVFSMSCDVGQFNSGVYDGIQYLSDGVLTGPVKSTEWAPVPDSLQPAPSTMDADYGPEEWILKHSTGGAALIAGHSWGKLGTDNLKTQPLDFIRALPIQNEELQIKFIGDAFNRMIYNYLERFKENLKNDEDALNHLLRINLFGDPTTPLFS